MKQEGCAVTRQPALAPTSQRQGEGVGGSATTRISEAQCEQQFEAWAKVLRRCYEGCAQHATWYHRVSMGCTTCIIVLQALAVGADELTLRPFAITLFMVGASIFKGWQIKFKFDVSAHKAALAVGYLRDQHLQLDQIRFESHYNGGIDEVKFWKLAKDVAFAIKACPEHVIVESQEFKAAGGTRSKSMRWGAQHLPRSRSSMRVGGLSRGPREGIPGPVTQVGRPRSEDYFDAEAVPRMVHFDPEAAHGVADTEAADSASEAEHDGGGALRPGDAVQGEGAAGMQEGRAPGLKWAPNEPQQAKLSEGAKQPSPAAAPEAEQPRQQAPEPKAKPPEEEAASTAAAAEAAGPSPRAESGRRLPGPPKPQPRLSQEQRQREESTDSAAATDMQPPRPQAPEPDAAEDPSDSRGAPKGAAPDGEPRVNLPKKISERSPGEVMQMLEPLLRIADGGTKTAKGFAEFFLWTNAIAACIELTLNVVNAAGFGSVAILASANTVFKGLQVKLALDVRHQEANAALDDFSKFLGRAAIFQSKFEHADSQFDVDKEYHALVHEYGELYVHYAKWLNPKLFRIRASEKE